MPSPRAAAAQPRSSRWGRCRRDHRLRRWVSLPPPASATSTGTC